MPSDLAWVSALSALEERSVELLGAGGREWVECCAAHVRYAVEEWGLHHVEPLTGGRGGLVLSARTMDGMSVVLKAPIVDPGTHIQAQCELAKAGVGPRVLAEDALRGLLLLEYITARPLRRPATRDERIEAAESVGRLHGHRSDASFADVSNWLAPRLEAAPGDRSPTAPPVDDRQRVRAHRTLTDLAASGGLSTFIHADLNTGNLLCRPGAGVVLIDARGLSGDPAYDYALLAVEASVPAEPTRTLERLAAELARRGGGDDARAAAWVDVVLAAMV